MIAQVGDAFEVISIGNVGVIVSLKRGKCHSSHVCQALANADSLMRAANDAGKPWRRR